MYRVTAEDIVDLSRWRAIHFADRETAERAMVRYRAYVARKAEQAAAAREQQRRRDEHVA
jgi:hypothetical protein